MGKSRDRRAPSSSSVSSTDAASGQRERAHEHARPARTDSLARDVPARAERAYTDAADLMGESEGQFRTFPADSVTAILARIREGDDHAHRDLFDLLYRELRERARAELRGWKQPSTLQSADLVHAVYLKLGHSTWNDRVHFFVTASNAMRQVLVDAHRRRRTRRESEESPPIDAIVTEFEGHAFDLDKLDLAIERLKQRDPVMAKSVVLRFFGGLLPDEVAQMLGLSLRTYQRRWERTRAWLFKELQ